MAKGLFDLTGKVTVVTGGNSGLGLAFARGIAKQGGHLAIWARNEEKNAAAKKELEAHGVKVSTHQVHDGKDREPGTVRPNSGVVRSVATRGTTPDLGLKAKPSSPASTVRV